MPDRVRADAGIHPVELLRLGVTGARRGRARSAVSIAVTALAVLAIVASTGRTAAVVREVRAGLETPDARLIRAIDMGGRSRLAPGDAARVGSLDRVVWHLALDPPQATARNAFAGDAVVGYARGSVGIRRYAGDLLLAGLASVASGRLPRQGEAVAGVSAAHDLGLADGRGAVESGGVAIPVVGVVAFSGALADLNGYVLADTPGDAGGGSWAVGTVIALVRSSADVERVAALLPAILGPDDPASLVVDEPGARNALLAGLAETASGLNTAILVGALGVCAVIVSISQFGAVSARRREIGLRRVEGAERTSIAALLLIETGLLGSLGALAGLVVGISLVAATTRTGIDPALGLSVAALVVVAGLAGALPPAVAAGRQEPLFALRG